MAVSAPRREQLLQMTLCLFIGLFLLKELLLRCYLDALDYRIATITTLHRAINNKFNEAGIEIAFTRCDLHLARPGPWTSGSRARRESGRRHLCDPAGFRRPPSRIFSPRRYRVF